MLGRADLHFGFVWGLDLVRHEVVQGVCGGLPTAQREGAHQPRLSVRRVHARKVRAELGA